MASGGEPGITSHGSKETGIDLADADPGGRAGQPVLGPHQYRRVSLRHRMGRHGGTALAPATLRSGGLGFGRAPWNRRFPYRLPQRLAHDHPCVAGAADAPATEILRKSLCLPRSLSWPGLSRDEPYYRATLGAGPRRRRPSGAGKPGRSSRVRTRGAGQRRTDRLLQASLGGAAR